MAPAIKAGLTLVVESRPPIAAQAADSEIWSADYWAKKGDVKLNLWRKRAGAPKAGEAAPVVFLVHGSSNSSRSSYDLSVPGNVAFEPPASVIQKWREWLTEFYGPHVAPAVIDLVAAEGPPRLVIPAPASAPAESETAEG